MFLIDSTAMKPNHALMRQYAERWAERGFRFNRDVWSGFANTTSEKAEQLRQMGLKHPDKPKEIAWFLRSFNSLEIASQLYDLQSAKWDLTVDALCEMSEKFNTIPELRVLFEYKQALATARSFITLERYIKDGDLVFPKVKTTTTNRIMFVEPYVSGLPKKCKPFLPIKSDALLLSVDSKSQEPNILINWFGSPGLRRISATEADIYKGVAKAASTPRVVAYEGAGASTTPVIDCGAWIWGKGDKLLYLENVYQSVFGLPELVNGVFISGERRKLPIKWGDSVDGVTGGEILPGALSYHLQQDERSEVKKVWNLMAYGGAKHTAITLCGKIDGSALADYIKSELNASPPKFGKGGVYTYFGTMLPSEKMSNYRAVNSRAMQGTGADLMALLVERFYSEPRHEDIDIYFTRYDELVMQVSDKFLGLHGGEGVGEYLRDIFEHKIDDFTPFRVDVELFN